MNKFNRITLWIFLVLLLSGCLRDRFIFSPPRIVRYVPSPSMDTNAIVRTEDAIATQNNKPTGQPLAIATILLKVPTSTLTTQTTATRTPSPNAFVPTPVPDHIPGTGMATLVGEGPYQLFIAPGGWQAYLIGSSADQRGYLVDVTPLAPAVDGAHIETRIVQEYLAEQWVDALWIRSPEIQEALPVQVNLIPTDGWAIKYEARVTLTPGDWMGFGMFDNAEGCGGVLDISLIDPKRPPFGSYIYNMRVQPEFPGPVWVQVARVQLSPGSIPQQAELRYYTPGDLAAEVFRTETTLPADVWSGWAIAPSEALQGYIVEVVPLEPSDNEIAISLVQPEFNGENWNDVLRLWVPEGRPPLDALVRVLAVKVK